MSSNRMMRFLGPFEYELSPSCQLRLALGDITHFQGDAIVNSAHRCLLGGGGVDGAIHRAAGPALLRYCRQWKEVSAGVRCCTGDAKITPGFELPASYVIHTVGPVYKGDDKSASSMLRSCYMSSLKLAEENEVKSIAFPSISCGVFRYPLDKAAKIALQTCRDCCLHVADTNTISVLRSIEFVLFEEKCMDAWIQAADAMLSPEASALDWP